MHKALPTAYAALEAALNGVEVERIVCPAWEGGHMDHDMCALLAHQLAARGFRGEGSGSTTSKFCPRRCSTAAAPSPQNGPVRRFKLSAGGLLRWMLAVRFFILQRAWLGLWPTMFWTY